MVQITDKQKEVFKEAFGHTIILNDVDTDWEIFKTIWKEAQKDIKKRILKLPIMKQGKRDGNKWYKQLCMELDELF